MSEQLSDLFEAAVGTVEVNRPTSAAFSDKGNYVESATGGYDSVENDDFHCWTITGKMEGEDPLAVPLVAALVEPYAVTAAGRVLNSNDVYRRHKLYRAILSRIAMTIEDGKAGTMSLAWRVVAQAASTAISQEHLVEDVVEADVTARVGTYKIVSAQHTVDGGETIALPGVTRVEWSAERQLNGTPENNGRFESLMDIGEWSVRGSIVIRDQALSDGATLGQRILVAGRGSLQVVACPTGKWDASATSPLANRTVTMARLKYKGNDTQLRRGRSDVPIEFGGLIKSALGAKLTLSQMVTAA